MSGEASANEGSTIAPERVRSVIGYNGGVGQAKPVGGPRGVYLDELVDEWGRQSFPASDPPSNW